VRRVALLLATLLAGTGPSPAADWEFATVEGADGVPLNLVTAGDPADPAIVLIHGIGQSHYSFVHQLDSDLARDFYLVTFDLRGHGASGKPWGPEAYGTRAWAGDVAAVLDASRARQPVVVAWSYGTLVLMDYVRLYGTARLGGINLTGATGGVTEFRTPPPDDPRMTRYAEIRRLQMSDDFADRSRAAERMVDLLTAEPVPEPYRGIFMDAGFMMPLYARRAMLDRSFDNLDLVDTLGELPVLISIGSEDNPFLTEDGRRLAERYDTVRFSAYVGAGHSVFFEKAQRFNAELRTFAARVHGRADGPLASRGRSAQDGE